MKSPHLATAPLDRRRFLRGAGVALALPLLEGMRSVFAKATEGTPRRMLLISNNLGVLPWHFFPKGAGTDYVASPYLEILAPHRRDFTVCSGLSHPNVSGGHSTENCFLTAAKDPTGSGFRNTISLDQYAVERLGQQTRFSTLNLGVNIDKANRSLSWTRDGVLLPAEDSAPAFVKQYVSFGAGPRASQALVLGAKARAVLAGRFAAEIEDVRALAPYVLRHRLVPSFRAEAEGVRAPDVVATVLREITP